MGFLKIFSKTFRAHFAQCFLGFRAHKVITRLHSRRTFFWPSVKILTAISQCYCVYSLAPSRRRPLSPSTITQPACVMTKSGADPARKATRATVRGQPGQPARSAARQPAPSPAVEPSASSFKPSIRQPPAVSRQPCPSPERRERPSKPSEQFSRPLTFRREASGHRPLSPSPLQCGGQTSADEAKNPPAATQKVVNIIC